MKTTRIISALLLIAALLSLASCNTENPFLSEKTFTKDDFSIKLNSMFSEPEDYSEYEAEEGDYNLILTSLDVTFYMFFEEFTYFEDLEEFTTDNYSLDAYLDLFFEVNEITDEPKYHGDIPYYDCYYDDTEGNVNSLIGRSFFFRSANAFYVCEFVYSADDTETPDKALAWAETIKFASLDEDSVTTAAQ